MWSAWGQPTAKGTMTGVSHTFLLISIFIRPSFCEDPERKGKEDLIISVISVCLLISVLLVVGCCFVHYKLMTTSMTVTKETKSFSIQTRHVENTVLLTPSQAMLLITSPQQSLQPTGSATPSPQSTPTPKRIPTQLSISSIYQGCSSESCPSDELGSIYSVDHFGQLDGSPQSTSRESLGSGGDPEAEEEGESSESESIILCAIQGM